MSRPDLSRRPSRPSTTFRPKSDAVTGDVTSEQAPETSLRGLEVDDQLELMFSPLLEDFEAPQRASSLRHAALAAERTGVLKDHLAVAEVMLVEGDALLGAGQKLRQEIFAFLDARPSRAMTPRRTGVMSFDDPNARPTSNRPL
jgi:hypothetical protein